MSSVKRILLICQAWIIFHSFYLGTFSSAVAICSLLFLACSLVSQTHNHAHLTGAESVVEHGSVRDKFDGCRIKICKRLIWSENKRITVQTNESNQLTRQNVKYGKLETSITENLGILPQACFLTPASSRDCKIAQMWIIVTFAYAWTSVQVYQVKAVLHLKFFYIIFFFK